eukprot:COSAG04_NODE_1307_length_7295_cov_1.983185_3_plen_415_part_00
MEPPFVNAHFFDLARRAGHAEAEARALQAQVVGVTGASEKRAAELLLMADFDINRSAEYHFTHPEDVQEAGDDEREGPQRHAVALHNYPAAGSEGAEGDLHLSEGDVVVVTDGSGEWWHGFLQTDPSTTGTFPSNFVKEMNAPPDWRSGAAVRDDAEASVHAKGARPTSAKLNRIAEEKDSSDTCTDDDDDDDGDDDDGGSSAASSASGPRGHRLYTGLYTGSPSTASMTAPVWVRSDTLAKAQEQMEEHKKEQGRADSPEGEGFRPGWHSALNRLQEEKLALGEEEGARTAAERKAELGASARHSSHMLTAHQQIAQQQLAGTQSNPHTSQLEALWHLPSQDRPEGEEATTAPRGVLGQSISFHGNAVAVKSACSTEDLCDFDMSRWLASDMPTCRVLTYLLLVACADGSWIC